MRLMLIFILRIALINYHLLPLEELHIIDQNLMHIGFLEVFIYLLQD